MKGDAEAYIAILDFELIAEKSTLEIHAKELPKFPAVTRDLAVIVDKTVPVGDIVNIIEGQKSDILEECALFDIYEGVQAGEGKKSVAYSIKFRAADKTLTDDDVAPVMNKILKELEEKNVIFLDTDSALKSSKTDGRILLEKAIVQMVSEKD